MTQNCSFQLLAPSPSSLTEMFHNSITEGSIHSQLLGTAQILRGQAYLKDGAIKASDLDCEGRYRMFDDECAWHLLMMDDGGNLIGCVRYLVHSPDVKYRTLRISQCAIAQHHYWGERVKIAVENDLGEARQKRLHYVEVGGWALVEQWRNTRAALEMLVTSFALGSIWGGCVGCCTATVRHSSSSMLRRLGGTSFKVGGETIPTYDDSTYGCTMELLRFDYRNPAPRYMPLIQPLVGKLSDIPVVTANDDNQADLTHDLGKLLLALNPSCAGAISAKVTRDASLLEETTATHLQCA